MGLGFVPTVDAKTSIAAGSSSGYVYICVLLRYREPSIWTQLWGGEGRGGEGRGGEGRGGEGRGGEGRGGEGRGGEGRGGEGRGGEGRGGVGRED